MEFNKHTMLALALGLVVGFTFGRAMPPKQAHRFEPYGIYLLDTTTGKVCDAIRDRRAPEDRKFPQCEQ